MSTNFTPRTMFEKIWDDHVVHAEPAKPTILYIDLQLVHEVTSPQAFEALRLSGRKVRRPERTVATPDHNVPTTGRGLPILDLIAKQQIDTLRANCREFGVTLYDIDDPRQGIVHVIGPELGLTQPGATIVCGDSHTATHGAFGALAFGIGTSEVEHVLATQTLLQHKPKTLEIRLHGRLAAGVTAKDAILWIIGRISTSGGTGYCIEYTGEAIRRMSMEERMTVCNMTIEGGRAGGHDRPRRHNLRISRRPAVRSAGRISKPPSPAGKRFQATPAQVRPRRSNSTPVKIDPQVTWGTNPGQVVDVNGRVPDPADIADPNDRKAAEAALQVHGPAAAAADRRHPDRPRLHRLLHQRADRRPPRRRRRGPRPPRRRRRRGDGRARQRTGQAPGRGRGARQGLHGGGHGLARAGVQHVPGDESRQVGAGPAVRRHQQSKLRGAAGQGRTHPSRLPRHGRRRRDRRPFCRRAAVELTNKRAAHATLHPTRRAGPSHGPLQRGHRSDHPQAVPQADRAERLRAVPLFRLAVPRRRLRQSRLRVEPTRIRRGDDPPGAANFGSGSSREHAPWALEDYGFRVLIAPSFADIFYNNCFKNGLLPIQLDEAAIDGLFARCAAHRGYRLTVDLQSCRIADDYGLSLAFEVNESRRQSLLQGLDDIALTLQHENKIAAYERAQGIA